jgi:hypothetical protein
MAHKPGPKILVLDIETKPIVSYTWGLFDQNVGLNQIKEDWSVLSFCAKWLGEKEVFYSDLRGQKDIKNDKPLLVKVWALLDEADILLTQNGNSFDIKKLNARFVLNGMKPPSSYKRIDTLLIAKKMFKFTSNKLEYMTDKLCVKYKKLKHTRYPGFELWSAVMEGKLDAWKEMEKYNIHDVLSLEELYTKLAPWDNSINFGLYYLGTEDLQVCSCGAKGLESFARYGYAYTQLGKFQRFQCKHCGSETRSRTNLLLKEVKKDVRFRTVR